MEPATEVLWRAVREEGLPASDRALAWGLDPELAIAKVPRVIVVDAWAPARDRWAELGVNCLTDLSALEAAGFDVAWVRPERQVQARQARIARAIRAVRPGGALWVVLPVREGGKRLAAELEDLGLEVERVDSRARCRLVRARRPEGADLPRVDEVIARDEPARVLDGLWSRPGLFSWNEVDPGTRLLADTLPDRLGERVADAGAGQGWLAWKVLELPGRCEHLDLLEADGRAVELARRNLAPHVGRWSVHHVDATAPWPVKHLNAVVSNPPFHRGGDHDIGLTEQVIAQGARAMLPGGRMYAVGVHSVPIGRMMRAHLAKVEEVASRDGYRVWRGTRSSR